MNAVAERLLQIADNPNGMRPTEAFALVRDHSDAMLKKFLGRLERAGQLFKFRPPGRRFARYFVSAAARDTYAAAWVDPTLAPKPVKVPSPKRGYVPVALRPVETRVRNPVITPETKFTVCPPWEPRFQSTIEFANQRGRVVR